MISDRLFCDRLGPEPDWSVVDDELSLALTDPDEGIDCWFDEATWERALTSRGWPARRGGYVIDDLVREYTSYPIFPTLIRRAAALQALVRHWPEADELALASLHRILAASDHQVDADEVTVERMRENLVLSRLRAATLTPGDQVTYRHGRHDYEALVRRVHPVGATIRWVWGTGKAAVKTVPAHRLTPTGTTAPRTEQP